jgi:hypothetical protein
MEDHLAAVEDTGLKVRQSNWPVLAVMQVNSGKAALVEDSKEDRD